MGAQTKGTLHKLNILVPESRELDLFAGMLEAQGARALRCPLVQIVELDDDSAAQAWIERMIARPFDDTILLTGDGLRKLLPISGARQDAFIAALQQTRIITRGPKPARALREIGLSQFLAAGAPTSQGVLDTLAAEDLTGRRIGLQLYPGDGAQFLVRALKERGAGVDTVTPYRYATEAESATVAGMIRKLAAGAIQMIAFTSTPQLQRLFTVAEEYQLERELRDGLARAAIAAIGPVMEEALAKHGLKATISPKTSFHMKPMVKAICEAWPQMVPA